MIHFSRHRSLGIMLLLLGYWVGYTPSIGHAQQDTTNQLAFTNIPDSFKAAYGVGGIVEVLGDTQGQALRQMGMTWVKQRIEWQPASVPEEHLPVITQSHAHGLKILFTVTGSPELTAPINAPEYAAFVARLAALGADGIEVWENQNDPDSWKEVSVGQYSNWLRQSYRSIKAVAPQTMVITGGLQPTVIYPTCTEEGCNDLTYLQEFVKQKSSRYADCVGVHYNEGIISPSVTRNDPRKPADYYTRYFHGMEYVYRDTLNESLPLCFTELGYLSGQEWGGLPNQLNNGYDLTVQQQASYLAEAVVLSASSPSIRLMFVNRVDSPTAPTADEFTAARGYAMTRPGGTCPSCDSVQGVLKIIKSRTETTEIAWAAPTPTPFVESPVSVGTLTAQDSMLLQQAQQVRSSRLLGLQKRVAVATAIPTVTAVWLPQPVLQIPAPTAIAPSPVVPTAVPPTPAPTAVPPTAIPPTPAPTAIPPTAVPPTPAPTAIPPTAVPPTAIPPTAAPPPSIPFGLGGQVDGFGQNAVDAMRRAGMTWVKRQVRWSSGSRAEDASYLIADGHAKGFKVLLSVVIERNDTAPSNFANYAQFVAQLAQHGADAIEVHNEPNLVREWRDGEVSPASYTDLLRQSYGAIKSVAPQTLVISAAPAPTGFFGGCSGAGCDDLPFLQGMAAAGAGGAMDCIGAHYNEGLVSPLQMGGDPRGSSEHYTRYYQGILNTYSSVFGGQKPICFTEVGFLTGEGYGDLPAGFGWRGLPGYGNINMTLADHARFHGEAVQVARQRGVLLHIVWNVDFTQRGDDPFAAFAMIRPDGSCPACDALAAAVR